MNVALVERVDGRSYLLCDSTAEPLRAEADVMDLIAAGWEHDVTRAVIGEQALTDEFFQLRTGLAGIALQKLVNYRFRTAIIVPDEAAVRGRAKEMVAELNKGRDFRVFARISDAGASLDAE